MGRQQIQVPSDLSGEGFVGRRHGVGDKGLRSRKARLPVHVDAEVAHVHIGLGEDRRLMLYLDRVWRGEPDPLEGLVHVSF